MSLIAWLPLNESTIASYRTNNGLGSFRGTNGNCSVSATGVISEYCTIFDHLSQTSYISLSGDELAFSTNAFSFCAWIKLTTIPNSSGYYSWDTSKTRMYLWGCSPSSSSSTHFYAGINTSDAYHYVLSVFAGGNGRLTIPIDSLGLYPGTWVHLTITYNQTDKWSVYINGSLIDKSSYIINNLVTLQNFGTPFYIGSYKSSLNSSGSDACFGGSMNDFRIYDHCLSPKEVKEISKGLILHYNFNDEEIECTTNVFPSKRDFTVTNMWTRGNENSTTPTVDPVTNQIVLYGSTSGKSYVEYAHPFSVSKNIDYTVSFQAKTYLPLTRIETQVREYDSSNNLVATQSSNTTIIQSFDSWQTCQCSFKITRTDTSRISIRISCTTPADTKVFLRNNSIQLEMKNHSTPYAESARVNTIVYDNSGFGHNGVLTDPLQHQNPTINRLDSVSSNLVYGLKLDGECYITTESPTAEAKTLSVWMSDFDGSAITTNQVLVADKKSNLCIGFYNNGTKLIVATTSARTVYTISNLRTNYPNNITVVKTSSTVTECYINGVKLQASGGTQNNYTHNTNTFLVGCRNNGSESQFFDRMVIDVKLYATVLSEEDIIAEYKKWASLTKTGILISNNFTERIGLDINNVKIASHVVRGYNLIEQDQTNFKPAWKEGASKVAASITDKQIYRNAYIENTNGDKYITTYVSGNNNNLRIVVDYEPLMAGQMAIFSARDDASGGISFWTDGYCQFGNASAQISGVTQTGRHIVELSKDGLIFDGTKLNFTAGTNMHNKLITLFRVPNDSRTFKGRIYDVQIYDGTELISHLVPVTHYYYGAWTTSMFDLINNLFYVVDGTSPYTFTQPPQNDVAVHANLAALYAKNFIEK